MSPHVIVVANLKGGSSKTTTAAHLAAALHESGLKVLCVDADPQGSCLRWSEAAGRRHHSSLNLGAQLCEELLVLRRDKQPAALHGAQDVVSLPPPARGFGVPSLF